MRAARPAAERGGSIAPERIDDAIAAETGGEIVMTETGTGQTSAEGDQGRDQGIVIMSAKAHTGIDHGHAQESTGGIDRGAKSAGARVIATDHQKTVSMAAQEVRGETKGVAIAAGAAAGRPTSTRDHDEEVSIE